MTPPPTPHDHARARLWTGLFVALMIVACLIAVVATALYISLGTWTP
jgi:ABC-type transporter Mla subunit MlaD